VSESILDHGYIPEEHAPDPVIGHGDPTPPGKVGIWLFLASEIMFFIGILATYIIFRSGSPHIFAEHAMILSKPLAGVNTLVLILSSLTVALAVDAAQKGLKNRLIGCLAATVVCAFGFMAIKYVEYEAKLTHHTIVASEVDPATKKPVLYVYDGHITKRNDKTIEFHGPRARVEQDAKEPFNIHWMSEHGVAELSKRQQSAPANTPGHSASAAPDFLRDIPGGGVEAATKAAADPHAVSEGKHDAGGEHWTIEKGRIAQDITYGPWKNIFFACYFTLTGIHGLHVVGGIIALGLLLIQAMRGKIFPHHTEYIGLYWHFVDLVWIFLFPLLYLI
jgi:cytochrome c oxidase subunit III